MPHASSISIFEEARNAIGILELLERYGFPLRRVGSRWRSSRCPACGQSFDSKSVRLVIFEETNRWYCHRCEARGDVITAVAEIEGLSPLEAAREILNDTYGYGVELRSVGDVKKREDQKNEARSEIVEKLLAIASRARGSRRHCWRYLIGERKIPERVVREAIRRKFLYFLPNFFQVRQEIEKFSPDLVEKAGFLKINEETGEVKNTLPFLVGRRPIVAPFNLYLEEKGRGAEFRTVNGAEPKTITLGPKGFWLWRAKSRHLLVVEGVIDLLSAIAMGWRGNILGLSGVKEIKKVSPILEGRNFEIWLALDGDEAGQEMTEWAVSEGLAKQVFSLPEGKDLNDLCKDGLSFRDLPYKTL